MTLKYAITYNSRIDQWKGVSRRKLKMKKNVIFLFVVFLAQIPLAATADMAILNFGIPPQQSPTEVIKRWTPVMQYLEKKTGLILELKTAKDIPTFQNQIMEGLYDIAFVNPNTYVAANKAKGYLAFAQEKEGKSFGMIVVRKDGPINNLSQLNGQILAFPSNYAVMATILPLKKLEEQKVAVKIQYVISMDSVYRSVAKGLFVAGGGEGRTFGLLDPEIRRQLVVLWRSDDLPPFPFFSHPRVPASTLSLLQKAMFAMGQDPDAQVLLKAVNLKGLEKATDADYNGVRKLNLPLQVK